MDLREPAALWLVRHGQSLGNVAREAAHAADLERLDLAERDMDVPLSDLGIEQAASFGRWLGALPVEQQPSIVVSSPYRRALDTARGLCAAASVAAPIRLDERLRERELGILDLLTTRGVQAHHPAEAERRRRLGKFYHRPPGGESWVDVALRLRSFRDSIAREHADERVLVVTHEVVIVIMRYLADGLDERTALALAADEPLANCSLTSYERDASGRLVLAAAGWTVPLDVDGTTVTEEPDARVAPR